MALWTGNRCPRNGVDAGKGKDLETLMKEQIFDPLGMNDTRFFLSEAEIPNLADLHQVKKEGSYE